MNRISEGNKSIQFKLIILEGDNVIAALLPLNPLV